ncbi:MAG: hypothetical protein O2954_06005 [bacterium]|nr:hypothetical protein [bacterium]
MNRDSVIFLAFVAVFGAINIYLLGSGRLVADWTGFGVILAAGLTLALYSFLYRDNQLFKFAEHLYVGVVAAYELAQVWYQNILVDVVDPLFRADPRWLVLVPTFLGLFLMTRLVGKGVWLSRLSFAFFVGLGAGLSIPRRIASFVLQQIEPSIRPIWQTGTGLDINAIIILVGVVSVLVYFYFSVEHKGVVGGVSRVGIWFLMISFGASFGYTVMARLSLLIGRVSFLMEDWLHLNLPLF